MADTREPLFVEIADGSLRGGGSGQHTAPLERCPVAQENRPPLTGWCDTCHIVQYDGCEVFQWFGRRADGRFYPYGRMMRLTEAGRVALAKAQETSHD